MLRRFYAVHVVVLVLRKMPIQSFNVINLSDT